VKPLWLPASVEICSNQRLCNEITGGYDNLREFRFGGDMTGRIARAIAYAAMVVGAAFVSPAQAEATQDWKCNALTDIPLDERIAACTSVIETGKYGRLAIVRAYRMRAAAYHTKREFEHAIADYDVLIELDPEMMHAYYCRAVAYLRLGDLERAIPDFDRTIQLNPKNRGAYYGRGFAYSRKGDFEYAIADYTQAIELRHQNQAETKGRAVPDHQNVDRLLAPADHDLGVEPDSRDTRLLVSRAAAYSGKGDFDRAIADLDQALRLTPKDAFAYRARGMTYLQSGSLSKSLADLDQSTSLDPKDAYAALWRDIVSKRSDQPSRLAEAANRIDMAKWPAPIIRLFLGEMTAEEVLGAADDADPFKKKGQVCEANFYTAELALQQGGRERARQLLQLAITDCPKSFIEWPAANAELKAMGATP
jgi:lipoprotein NlpI